jgi:non-homologous end joining protein Ku
MKGKKITLTEPEKETDSGVLDLMSRLKASLDQGSAKKTGSAKKKTSTRTRTTKRKSA